MKDKAKQRAAAKRYREKNREKTRQASRKWRAANLEEARRYARDYAKQPEYKRKKQAKMYGLSVAELVELEELQDHSCAACGREGKLVIDHCHATGKVRGLLCRQCNLALGYVNDNGVQLMALAAYLKGEL